MFRKSFGRNYGLVIFQEEFSAIKATRQTKQIIRKIIVTVESPLRFRIQNNQMDLSMFFRPPPDADSPHNILNTLDDDCLKELFKHLKLRDLCAVADVCTRFKSNAEYIFSRKYSDLILDNDDDIYRMLILVRNELYFDHLGEIPLIKNIFRLFGPYIKSIDFPTRHSENILRPMAMYCSIERCSIEKLDFSRFNIRRANFFQGLQSIFSRLKILNINLYEDKYQPLRANLLDACRKLNDLIIYDQTTLNDGHFSVVLQANPNLKKLQFHFTMKNNITSNIFRSIGTHALELETLELNGEVKNINKEDIASLGSLKKLKQLTIDGSRSEYIFAYILFNALANGDVPVEKLTVKSFELDEITANSLSRLTQIKKLNINAHILNVDNFVHVIGHMNDIESLICVCFNSNLPKKVLTANNLSIDDIVKITSMATKLEYLECTLREGLIDEKKFNAIVQAIKARKNGAALKIHLVNDGEAARIMVKKIVQDQNRQWLTLDSISIN